MSRMREYRKKKKMSQQDIATALGVTQSMVAKWENGVNYPSVELLIELSDLFGCTIDELVRGEKR